MKLKSISIHGFKTFADRVNVQFHDGITGIIGPNGCGKSNAIAAVRWVMGEQTSKNLRDPAEIIFAGAQNRKPLNMAEVVLTFTNDGKGCPPDLMHLPEISIGRRVFRGGEREYFMNKEPCRLKDIVDFLLAIGLGARGYSIIEQEKRDRIIQASPDDLREILEETAGITIFKQHRHDAEKRLSSTSDKMKSLSEIEGELTKQSENLQDQVEKVAQKHKLVNDLRDREIHLLCHRVGLFRALASRVRMEINNASQDVQTSVVASSEWEARANDQKAEQMQLQSALRDLEDALEEKKIALTKYEERHDNQKRRAEDRVKRRETLNHTLTEERQILAREEERLSTYLTDLDKVQGELRGLDGEIEGLQERLDEVDEGMRVDRVRGEELRSEIRAVQEALSTLRTRNESVLERISRANSSLKRNEELMAEGESARGQIVADRGAIESQLNAISEGMNEVAAEKARIDAQLGAVDEELDAARKLRDDAKEKMLEVNSTLQALQKLQSANEGLSDGARVLRSRLSSLIQGFLFENITVHPEDEQILEGAVPELLESALVENVDTLVDLLDKVEEMDLTRVGFLSQDVLVPLSEAEESARRRICAIPGVRSVGERVRSVAKPQLQYLLDRVFVARDEWLLFKAQRTAAAEGAGAFVFVSERGVVASGTREVAFGKRAEGDSSGLLQRKREIAELTARKEELQKELAAAEGRLYGITERKKALEGENAQVENRLSKEKVEVLKLTSAIDGFNLKLKHVEENLTRLATERDNLAAEIGRDRELYSKNLEQTDVCERDMRNYTRELEDFESEFSERKELRDTLSTQLQNRRSQRGIIVERTENYRKNYEDLRYHLKRVQQNVDKAIAELTELDSQMSASADEDASLLREIAGLRADVVRIEGELEETLSREAEVSEQLRVVENKIKSQRDIHAARQKIINEKNMELARCEAVLQTAEKEAMERFQLAPSDLPNEAADEPGLEGALENEIHKLKKAVEELGPVNERALEEYQAVEARRSFLTSQKEDIERSVVELQRAINEIEETTKVRFKEIYEQVNKEFQALFPILFPGGEAHLNLLNPEDLLTTGVEILVRLPGKRQQRMHLFSGGEKALTAISLIFALLKTHPAPFCFLDEVDAPLDEANVGRFNTVLETLGSEFQFVVITHNRRTMEVLDTIYGISMQEPGVSKLVAVDLTDVPPHLRKQQKVAVAAPRSGAVVAN